MTCFPSAAVTRRQAMGRLRRHRHRISESAGSEFGFEFFRIFHLFDQAQRCRRIRACSARWNSPRFAPHLTARPAQSHALRNARRAPPRPRLVLLRRHPALPPPTALRRLPVRGCPPRVRPPRRIRSTSVRNTLMPTAFRCRQVLNCTLKYTSQNEE